MTTELPSRYRCPSCDHNILNRKIDRCLYCGATLPAELLFTKEKIATLDEQTRGLQEQERRLRPDHVASRTDDGFGIGDAIDVASDLSDLF